MIISVSHCRSVAAGFAVGRSYLNRNPERSCADLIMRRGAFSTGLLRRVLVFDGKRRNPDGSDFLVANCEHCAIAAAVIAGAAEVEAARLARLSSVPDEEAA